MRFIKRVNRKVIYVGFAIFVVGMLLLIHLDNAIEKKVNDDFEKYIIDYSNSFFVNKPLYLFDFNGDLTGEMEYTYFPSGNCNITFNYNNYYVHDITVANIFILNSNITNCYMHNVTADNCNIEDSTFINSTVQNCYIGDNVTFINCPPDSDPELGKELSEYLAEKLEEKYNTVKQSHQSDFDRSNELMEWMRDSLTPASETPSQSDLIFYALNKTNITIQSLYYEDPIDYNMQYSHLFVDAYTINISIIHTKDNNINISTVGQMRITMDEGWNGTSCDYAAIMTYDDNINNWSNDINEKLYKLQYSDENEIADYNNFSMCVTGANNTSIHSSEFNYYSTVNITFNDKYFEDNHWTMNEDSEYIEYYRQDIDKNEKWTFSNTTHNGTKMKMIRMMKINSSSKNVSIQEYALNPYYSWANRNSTSENTSAVYILPNGTVDDPTYKRIEKRRYSRRILWRRVTSGGKIVYWYQLTKKDVSNINKHAWTVGFVSFVASIIPFTPTQIAGVIVGAICLFWGWMDRRFKDPTDGDMEFRIVTAGYFLSGGLTTIYGYRYDHPDDSRDYIWWRYHSPYEFYAIWRLA